MTNETDNITNDAIQKLQAEFRRGLSNDTITVRRSGKPNELSIFVGDRFAITLIPDIGGDEGDFTFIKGEDPKNETQDKIKELQAQLRKAFSDETIILQQGIAGHVIDASKGDKFFGTIFRDVGEDGEKTYTFHVKVSNL